MTRHDGGSSVGVPVEDWHGEDGLPRNVVVSARFPKFQGTVLYRDECRREKEHCQERDTFHRRAVSLARGSDTL